MRDNTILRIISLFLFSFLLILPISVFAQSTGSMGGRITDVKSGSPLVGAVIKIDGSNMGAVADDNGEYVILNVDVGSYTLLCSYIGYETKKLTNVRVSVDGKSKANNNTKVTVMNTLEVKGDWNITKGKLKQKWAKLTDDDLQFAEGKQEELLGRIQKRTGESREAVEKALKEACSCGCCGCKK